MPIFVNNRAAGTGKPGTYAVLDRTWKAGDTIGTKKKNGVVTAIGVVITLRKLDCAITSGAKGLANGAPCAMPNRTTSTMAIRTS